MRRACLLHNELGDEILCPGIHPAVVGSATTASKLSWKIRPRV